MDRGDYLDVKASLTESDHNAIISTGQNSFQVLPVFIRDEESGQKLLVEWNEQFVEAGTVRGLVRFEKTPQARAAQV